MLVTILQTGLEGDKVTGEERPDEGALAGGA
jgi:hypothetical protein